MTPPETQLSTPTSTPPATRPAAGAGPGRMSAAFAELILEDAPSEEFFRRFLLQVLRNSGAAGGAVWLVETAAKENSPGFHLESFLDLSKSGFPFAFDQLSPEVLSCLNQVVATRQKLIVYPTRPSDAKKEVANPNTSPFAWFFSSIEFRGGVLGVLMLLLDANWVPKEASNRITFVDHLGQYVSTHLLLRRKNQSAKKEKVLGKLLEFTTGIVGELRKEELGIFIAGALRDVASCNRASVFEFKSGRWGALTVSGNDEIDRASRLVCTMQEAFAELAQKAPLTVQNYSEERENEDLGPSCKKLISVSNTRSLLTIAMNDGEGRKAFGIMLESDKEGYFTPQAGTRKGLDGSDIVAVVLWLADHAGKALVASRTHQSIPFSGPLTRLHEARLALGEQKGKRRAYYWGGLAGLFLVAGLIPWKERAVGECSLLPSKRAVVVAETTGRLNEVNVREGSLVAADQAVAKLDTLTLETNLEIARQERMRLDADVRRFQAAGDMAAYQVAWHQSRKASEQENKLQQDIARAELRSPIAGIVLTKDVDLRRGEVLPIGRELCEVASLQDWNLQVDIEEADFGIVENALKRGKPIEVEYILYARSSVKLKTQVRSIDQLSQMAYAKGTENVFFVTVSGIPLPQELQSDVRPGFSGKARVLVGSRPLFLVLSRKFIHFLRVHFLV